VACKSQNLVAVAYFLPGRAKDLSAPRYYWKIRLTLSWYRTLRRERSW